MPTIEIKLERKMRVRTWVNKEKIYKNIDIISMLKPIDEKCPKCDSPMRKLMGKYGEFTACSGYPKCKYIKQNKAGYNCPSCKKGELVERVWRGGKFWGCSNYPKCKYTKDLK